MLYESLRKLIVETASPNAEDTFVGLDLTFSVQTTVEEGDSQVELVKDGKNVAVCPSNVHDYVRLYAEQRMLASNTKSLQVMSTTLIQVGVWNRSTLRAEVLWSPYAPTSESFNLPMVRPICDQPPSTIVDHSLRLKNNNWQVKGRQ